MCLLSTFIFSIQASKHEKPCIAIVILQDETILAETICLLLYVGCPRNTQIVFQCGQFATMCLERIQICDGFRDCESGFDESTEICSGSMSTDMHNIMVLIAHEIGQLYVIAMLHAMVWCI